MAVDSLDAIGVYCHVSGQSYSLPTDLLSILHVHPFPPYYSVIIMFSTLLLNYKTGF